MEIIRNFYQSCVVTMVLTSYVEALALAIAVIAASTMKKSVKKRNRRYWAKKWLQQRNRYSHLNLVRELQESSTADLKNYLRMDDATFQMLLSKINK